MSTNRNTYKYHFKIGSQIVHTGIAIDIESCERDHKNKPGWSKGHIKQVGRRTTRRAALEWGWEQAKAGKPVRKK